jgi:hypothetical protein
MPTRFSLALTTRVLASRFKPVFKVVVAVARSGIWKMAVPPSVRTLKMFPVRFAALTTSLMTSPEVKAEVEAVSQFPVVAVVEAVRTPALVIWNLVSVASAMEKVSVTLKVELMVEEALTKMPAVVEVGVKVAWPEKAFSKAPFCPGAPVPQAAAAAVTFKEPSSSRHLEAVREFKVKVEVITAVPLSRVEPTTPKVVVGTSVPMPTRFSLALTTRVLASRLMPVFKVVVAVARSGIWKMAVPPSVRTLNMLPVRLAELTTSLMTSPVVRAEEEAVKKLPVVMLEEEAMIWPEELI